MAEVPKITIVIKTLKAQRHNLEVVLEQNVADLKKQIETQLSLGQASAMKLIHHGKILKDDQLLSSINLKEGDFVVLMTTKKKKSAKQTAASTQPQPTQPPAATNNANANNQPANTSATQPQQPQQAAPPAASSGDDSNLSGASALVPPNQVNTAVQNLMNMGFPEAECRAALAAAFNNPDRAVEYLINGIPDSARRMVQQPPPQQQQQAPSGGPSGPSSGPGPAASGGMGAPPAGNTVQSILQSLLQNPQLLNSILQEIQRIRPQEYEAIMVGFNNQSNPQQSLQRFAALMADTEVLQHIVNVLIQMVSNGGSGGAPRGVQRVSVNQEELDQIRRLAETTNLSQEEALRLFLRAGRNAELAASLIFEAQASGGMGLFGAAPQQNANQQSGGPAENANANPVQANNANASENMEVEENSNNDANSGDANNGDNTDPNANSGDTS